MKAEDVDRRIANLVAGASLSAMCGFITWMGCAGLTMMMNPELVGADYWREVRNRAGNNPVVVGVIGCGCIGVVAGVVLMVRSLVRRPHNPGGTP